MRAPLSLPIPGIFGGKSQAGSMMLPECSFVSEKNWT